MGFETACRSGIVTLCLSGTEADIHEPDGFAEETLWKRRDQFRQALPDYWASCVNRLGDVTDVTRDHILSLREPDQVHLALEIGKARFGKRPIVLRSSCVRCGVPVDYEEYLSEIEDPKPPKGLEGAIDPVFSTTLSRSGTIVTFGYPTGHDEQRVMRICQEHPTLSFYAAIRTVNGRDKFSAVDFLSLMSEDLGELRAAIEKHSFQVDTKRRLTHECGQSQVVNVLMDPSFLFPGRIV